MTTRSPLPCPVCHRVGYELDETDKYGRLWSVCEGPHDAETEAINPDGSRRIIVIPDTLLYTHDIRNLLQANGRLMSHTIDAREWLVRIMVDGKALTLQSHPNLISADQPA